MVSKRTERKNMDRKKIGIKSTQENSQQAIKFGIRFVCGYCLKSKVIVYSNSPAYFGYEWLALSLPQ